jgi:hypothetical protein
MFKKMLYFSDIHFVISYCVLFWVNSSDSTKILRIQNKIIRITANLRNRNSCRNIFKIMTCLVYITNNKRLCINNQEIHNINTRSNPQFLISSTNLKKRCLTQELNFSVTCDHI